MLTSEVARSFLERTLYGEDIDTAMLSILNEVPDDYLQILRRDGYSAEEIAFRLRDGVAITHSTRVYEKFSQLNVPLAVHEQYYRDVVGVGNDSEFVSKADAYYTSYGASAESQLDSACKFILDNIDDQNVRTFLALCEEYYPYDQPEEVLLKQHKMTYQKEFPVTPDAPIDIKHLLGVMDTQGYASEAKISKGMEEWIGARMSILDKLMNCGADLSDWKVLYKIAMTYMPKHSLLKLADGFDIMSLLTMYGKEAVDLHCEKLQKKNREESIEYLRSLNKTELYALIRQVVYSAYGRLVPQGKEAIESDTPMEYAALLADSLADNYNLMFGDTIVPLLNLLREV